MREIARLPGNTGRIQVFVLPHLGTAFSGIPNGYACSSGANDLLPCNPNDGGSCPSGVCESLPNYALFVNAGLAGDPILLGHEMGHHFCLAHTHTAADPNQSGGSSPRTRIRPTPTATVSATPAISTWTRTAPSRLPSANS